MTPTTNDPKPQSTSCQLSGQAHAAVRGTPVNDRDPQVWAAYQEQLRRQQGCVGCGG